MLKKEITFEDFETGEQRTETWYFNLSKRELIALEVTNDGGYEAAMQRIIEAKDGRAIMDEFERFILDSVGEKTEAGGFRKSEEIKRRFRESPAFDELFMELVTNAEAGANFLKAIVPQSLGNRLSEVENQQAIREAQADLTKQYAPSAREIADQYTQEDLDHNRVEIGHPLTPPSQPEGSLRRDLRGQVDGL